MPVHVPNLFNYACVLSVLDSDKRCIFITQVREIEGLSHLSHLRVLNLAGNDISCVANLSGLQALAELNLRRNRITSMVIYITTFTNVLQNDT